MADKLFQLEIVTPSSSFYTGEVEMLEVNTTEGRIGVYANHIPMTMIIAPGTMIITENAENKKKAALISGFLEITETKVTIMAEAVEWPQDIDVERAKKAEERARKRLESKDEKVDTARAEAALRRALVRIHMAE